MSGGAKKVVKVDQERQPYRTELTPVSFLRRARTSFRTGRRHPRRPALHLPAVRGARQPARLRSSPARASPLDRVAFLAPNIPAMLEAHFGVPAARRACWLPINTRLSADEIALHPRSTRARRSCSSTRVRAAGEGARPDGPPGGAHRRHRRARRSLRGLPRRRLARAGASRWLEDEYETISINYTSGTTGRPEGRHVHHRGAYLNALGEALETGLTFDAVSLDAADVPLQRLVLHLGRHRGRAPPTSACAASSRAGSGS